MKYVLLILGIILIIILFVPIRYNGLIKNNELQFSFDVSWLFGLFKYKYETDFKRNADGEKKSGKNSDEEKKQYSDDEDRISREIDKVSNVYSEYKAMFSRLWNNIKIIISRIKPYDISGHITFGLEDPADTGKVLALLTLFLPVYRDRLMITPLFNNEDFFDFDVTFHGRVFIVAILIPAIKILLDKDFRSFLKKQKKDGGHDGR